MNFEIDPETLAPLEAMWETPFGIAAKLLFVGGCVLMVILCVTRHKMSFGGALLALCGLKKVPNRDMFFNILLGIIMVGCLGLMVAAMQAVNSATV